MGLQCRGRHGGRQPLLSPIPALKHTGGHRMRNSPLSQYQMFQFNGINTRLSQADGLSLSSTIKNQLGGDDLSGKLKLKVEPFPASLSTQIFPPCSSTNFLASVNPSPVPSLL